MLTWQLVACYSPPLHPREKIVGTGKFCTRNLNTCCPPDCHNCGRPLAAVPMGAVTHNRIPHTQRLSLTDKLSGCAGTCQQPRSLSLHCVAADMLPAACTSKSTALHVVVLTVCAFVAVPNCNVVVVLFSWLPPLNGTNVYTATC